MKSIKLSHYTVLAAMGLASIPAFAMNLSEEQEPNAVGVRAQGNLSKEIELFKRNNAPNAQIDERLRIISGDASYLWLTSDQKNQLFQVLNSGDPLEGKIRVFDSSLKIMELMRPQ